MRGVLPGHGCFQHGGEAIELVGIFVDLAEGRRPVVVCRLAENDEAG